jgi:O-antigen biosynthesis protein
MIDIIIPTKGNTDYLFKCILSIRDKTVSTPYHIYICDTGSTSEEITLIEEFIRNNFKELKNVTLLKFNYYSFPRINNYAVENNCKSDVILFCNNDIELIDNCIDRMYDVICSREDVGTVGCRLLFEDGTIQHAGQFAFILNNHLEVTHRGLRTNNTFEPEEPIMGNTAGFMMIKREVFFEAGLFNPNYIECFEDVELNWSVFLNGKTNIYLDCVSATHFESTTRNMNPESRSRLMYDYKNNLVPFFDALTSLESSSLLDFNR